MSDKARECAEERTMQTPLEDLRRNALEHYEKLSNAACDWSSVIPQAINFYFDCKAGQHFPPAVPVAWIPVTERLPEEKIGVSYMSCLTDVVLVRLRDRPGYPLTAHAVLGDDLSVAGVAIPTNGASKYKQIAWYSAGRKLNNPFNVAAGPEGPFRSGSYDRFLPNYFGRAITHWMPLPDGALITEQEQT
jgi:hypothetical protein